MKIAILGAGQLGYFLCLEAKKLGHHVTVIGDAEGAPALAVAHRTLISSNRRDDQHLQDILSSVDLVIFENEWMTDFKLPPHPPKVYPPLETMKTLSNKLEQKRLFAKLNLASPKFQEFHQTPNFEDLITNYPNGFVIKHAVEGYDGYGVLMMRPAAFTNPLSRSQGEDFMAAAFAKGQSVYVEELVEFKRELALVIVRSVTGDFAFYPLVETQQDQGTCRLVLGPIPQKNLEDAAQGMARTLGNTMAMVGTYAIEFFEGPDGLLVNEVAPRVHNSGHFSLDAAETNQFKNHILATTGQDLGSTQVHQVFGMLNILGPQNYRGDIAPPGDLPKGACLHWYQKHQSKPRRKLAHINLSAAHQGDLTKVLQDCELAIKKWDKRYAQ